MRRAAPRMPAGSARLGEARPVCPLAASPVVHVGPRARGAVRGTTVHVRSGGSSGELFLGLARFQKHEQS